MNNEKQLPANIFRWQSPDGIEVLAFRISRAYCTHDMQVDLTEIVHEIIAELPYGIHDAMCFYGVGDHGGGPTKKQIEWIIQNKNSLDNISLKFSHPRAFFDAIKNEAGKLAVVKDELQHHSIGCYSVERRIKTGMLKAEKELSNASFALNAYPEYVTEYTKKKLEDAQYDLLFNQFHDILGGTCLDSASRQAAGELSAAASSAREVFTNITRSMSRKLADSGVHKIIVLNPNSFDYTGPVFHDPWLQFRLNSSLELLDGNTPVKFQRIKAQAPADISRIIWNDSIPARGMKVYRLVETRSDGINKQLCNSIFHDIKTDEIALKVGNRKLVKINGEKIIIGDMAVCLKIFDDPTDTWSHSATNRFSTDIKGTILWDQSAKLIDKGDVTHAVTLKGSFDKSIVLCELRQIAGEDALRLGLYVNWAQVRQRLGLFLEMKDSISRRVDLVSGGPLQRDADGLEYPVAGMINLEAANQSAGIVCPDVTSASVADNSATFTLIRSPYTAHHDPAPADNIPRIVTDQGSHFFEIAIRLKAAEIEKMQEYPRSLANPPIAWDVTG